jgi:transposase
LNGFTLLFEAFILMLARQMPFAAVARIVGESPHRVLAVCQKYVQMACGLADYSDVTALAIDETSRSRGHSYVTLAADADARRVLFVTEGRDAKTIEQLAEYLNDHGCPAENIESASIDMSPAFIAGVTEHLPNARITFDKFHVIGHASTAVDKMRRIEQRTDKSLKGMRWTLLKDTAKLKPAAAADLDALIAKMAVKRTARAWVYKEQLREILDRKQINVVRAMLEHWCICVMRSKVDPMKEVARMIRSHLEGIVAWAQTRQTNGFLEAINGLFQAAKRRARGFHSYRNHQNSHLPDCRSSELPDHQPTCWATHLNFNRAKFFDQLRHRRGGRTITHEPHIQPCSPHHLECISDGIVDPVVIVAESAATKSREKDNI